MRQYLVNSADTLRQIAQNETGNYLNWQQIAEINNIDDVRNLVTGQVIQIPDISELSEQVQTTLSDFEKLSLSSVNNWQSIKWL